MKIRFKLFLFLWSIVGITIACLALTNDLYIEKFYTNYKKEKLIEVGSSIKVFQGNVDIRKLEMENNAEISVKNDRQLDRFIEKRRVSKEDIAEVREALENDEPIFKEANFSDYRGKSLVLFMRYSPGKYLEIVIPVSFIKKGLEISLIYHIQLIAICFIIGTIAAFFFSKIVTTPVLEIKEITEKISNLDFSQKFEDERKDEIGELGQAINKMGNTIENNLEEIRKINARLLHDIEIEKKMEKARKEFVACMSHELKTPLAIIQGYAYGLKDNINDEEDKNFYCDVIVEEVQQMQSLVRELLYISQIESGFFKSDFEYLNLYEIIRNNIEKLPIKDKKIDFEGEPQAFAYFDEKQIDRVIANLLGNAIKYDEDDAPIKIKLEKSKNHLFVSVKNKNSNIRKEELESIWQPFIRLPSSVGKEGHGLGLSIVAGILKNHKCEYGVYISEVNYVNFWFKLPCNKDF